MIDIFFPKQCIICNKNGDYLCQNCKKQMKPHAEICPYCHKFSIDYKTCLDCKMDKENVLEGIIIPFRYSDVIKKLILKLKYYHKSSVADFLIDRLYLAFFINKTLQKDIIKQNKKLYISYIPSHWRRHYFIKGYNQSQLLAKKISQKLNFKYIKIAKKNKNTKSQATLSREERLLNLKSVFLLNNKVNLDGDEIILLIDDITTTGATLNELGKIIKNKYPKIKIWGMVVGRHSG